MRWAFTVAAALYVSTLVIAAQQQEAVPAPKPPSARFDMEVRADFFAGFSGNEAAFKRAMARCEEVLAMDPDHAEALVWHGSGISSMAGRAFQAGDMQHGIQLWTKGLAEMNKAVELAPDDVGVRIPRGATLFEATRHLPDANQQQALLRVALSDYEHTLMLQKAIFSGLSDHAKGELLFGLAEGWSRAGDKDKAKHYFERLIADAATSGRTTYAKAWLDGAPPASLGRCVGCH
jgi:tetratricopeptide (TPR) repeat protein